MFSQLWLLLVWVSLRVGFSPWVPYSVFSAGGGRGSVEAWYAAALDIVEVLTGAADSGVRLFVADVIKSFDTVDMGILDRVLSSLGLLAWFRNAYFEYHAHVRLRFKPASGLGEPWTRGGGIPQGCFLSMMFLPCTCIGVVIQLLREGLSHSYMRIILSVYLGILTYYSKLLGSPLVMSGWLVRSLRLVSVYF